MLPYRFGEDKPRFANAHDESQRDAFSLSSASSVRAFPPSVPRHLGLASGRPRTFRFS